MYPKHTIITIVPILWACDALGEVRIFKRPNGLLIADADSTWRIPPPAEPARGPGGARFWQVAMWQLARRLCVRPAETGHPA
jgi:hypothetical protein